MSVTSGFFNGLNNDRTYNADQMSEMFDGIIKDGIFSSIGTALVATASSGVVVNVGIGKAWFNHRWIKNDSILPITCALSDVVLGRIDAIVIEIDNTDTVREGNIKFVAGTPSSTPVCPTMISTTNKHQYALCYINRVANSESITQSDITNMVGSTETPFISGLMETISLDILLPQWQDTLNQFLEDEQADITSWFETMVGLLGTDPATALQLQINDLKDSAGYSSKTTVFNTDGSITENFVNGTQSTTVFNTDGTITTTHKNIGGTVDRTTTITFNTDGSITEVIS